MLALVLACTTGGGSPTPEDREDFGAEGRMDRGGDPGMATRPKAQPKMSAPEFRTIYFEYDRSGLRADAKAALRHNASVLLDRSQLRVEIQGNSDERGDTEYNLALGIRRAEAAKRYLVDLGVEPSRIGTVSFGEENPAVRGHSEAAWAKNRRDDFAIQ